MRWIQSPFWSIYGNISGCCTSSPGLAHYKREHGAQKHDSSNHVEGLCVVTRSLAHVRDQGWPKYPGEAPGRQHQAIYGSDISRTEEVVALLRHRERFEILMRCFNNRILVFIRFGGPRFGD